ncbi:hypothetical protein JTB14_015801 [Gonioctena quinquepunctata]|nr:hypothetical protein JTB14_015801 [Gonioctena quinquepunctata]
MARVQVVVYFNCLIICATISSFVSGITLKPFTSKPRLTKYVPTPSESSDALSPPAPSATSKDNSGVAYYRLFNSRSRTTCILLKTDAVVEVKFKLHDLEEQADSFIPENALIDGECGDDFSSMRISWNGYGLVINFAKTLGGERWYIKDLVLIASPDIPQFHGISPYGKISSIKLYHKNMLIPTPVGKSHSCKEVEIELATDEEDDPPPGVHGTLFLRLLQVQPFMYKGENFEAAVECKPKTSFRDETAPIAVGSTLAIAVLATVTGYGIFRYFKVKNVQYNTME